MISKLNGKNIHRPNGSLFKLSCTQKLQRQKDFKGTQKPIQIMTTTRLHLILNTKHESWRQEYEVCKKMFKWDVILTTYENLNMKWNEYMMQDHTLN